MTRVRRHERAIVVDGDDRTLTYTGVAVAVDDGRRVVHESRGGDLSSVWASDLGGVYVEVVHLGDGPSGGELVLVVPSEDVVAVGGLWAPELPASVPPSWPVAVDLAVGLMTASTTVLTPHGTVTREDLEDLHQRLLGVLHG